MSREKPNILFIQSDQHRHDCVGYAGVFPVQTPNIDRLAGEGMIFTQAYTPIPLCAPARQALLNGRRPESFGGLWNFGSCFPTLHLQPDDYSWPRQLQQNGYRTGFVGKWHIHPHEGPSSFGFHDSELDANYKNERRSKHLQVKYTNGFMGEIDPVPLEDTYSHWAARKAEDLLRNYAASDEPWHLRVDFREPHPPCRPVQKFADLYRKEDIPPWGGFADDFANKPYMQKQQLANWDVDDFTWLDWSPVVARYYALITQMDQAVGRLLQLLDRLDQTQDTIVVYTSDHGDLCGSHRMMDKHYVMYDDVVRVPLVIRWPDKVQPGISCDRFVYNGLDLPPTLLEACGLKPQPFFHGKSLLPLLLEHQPDDWRTAVVSTYNGQQFGLYTQRMIRTTTHKYVWNLTDMDELYDLRSDPYELCNVISEGSYASVLAELRRSLHTELTAVEDPSINSFTEKQLLGRHVG